VGSPQRLGRHPQQPAVGQMKWHICWDAETAALECADRISRLAQEVVTERGRFLLAVSGGNTPRPMFRHLSGADMPWSKTYVFQTDERAAMRTGI
jgi:6-phosphogluconolactonase